MSTISRKIQPLPSTVSRSAELRQGDLDATKADGKLCREIKWMEFWHLKGIKLVHTAVHVPVMNSVCERFIGSVRRECLDHVIILSEAGMRRLVEEYVRYFNEYRPHQGLGQQIPAVAGQGDPSPSAPKLALVSSDSDNAQRVDRSVVSVPVLGGLHHHYYRLAA